MDAFMGSLFNADTTGWGAFGGLAIFVVISVARGWLVPGRTHDREMLTANKRGDEWKETALELRKENGTLIKSNEIVSDFFNKVTVNTPAGGTTELQAN